MRERIWDRLRRALKSDDESDLFDRRLSKAETAWVQGDLDYCDQLLELIGY